MKTIYLKWHCWCDWWFAHIWEIHHSVAMKSSRMNETQLISLLWSSWSTDERRQILWLQPLAPSALWIMQTQLLGKNTNIYLSTYVITTKYTGGGDEWHRIYTKQHQVSYLPLQCLSSGGNSLPARSGQCGETRGLIASMDTKMPISSTVKNNSTEKLSVEPLSLFVS